MFEHMPDYPMAVTAASGPDKTAVQLALRWLHNTTDDVGGGPLIYVPNNDCIREWPILTRLKGWAGLATWKTNVVTNGPVLALWPDFEHLAQVTDDRGTRALCVVPSYEAEVAAWVRAYRPVTLPPTLKLATEPAPEIIADPVVVEGLKTLTSLLNVTSLHVSSWQRGNAVGVLRILHDGGHPVNAEDTQAWTMAHGWSMRAAGQVAELAKQIAAGKQLRFKRDELRSDILDEWRQRAGWVPPSASPRW
jgi:hypothetical protein